MKRRSRDKTWGTGASCSSSLFARGGQGSPASFSKTTQPVACCSNVPRNSSALCDTPPRNPFSPPSEHWLSQEHCAAAPHSSLGIIFSRLDPLYSILVPLIASLGIWEFVLHLLSLCMASFCVFLIFSHHLIPQDSGRAVGVLVQLAFSPDKRTGLCCVAFHCRFLAESELSSFA